jgi:hypothetical protein
MLSLPRRSAYNDGVNYFAHAVRFIDRPWFLAGLATPDWLSVVDRKCRVRRVSILKHLPELGGDEKEVALGILQHLDDDQWFHGTAAFYDCVGQIGRWFREVQDPDENWRCGFLGHVVLELLIDGVLIARDPPQLARYYESLAQVDPGRVQESVARLATRPPRDLARFIGLFLQERFLEDYVDDLRLLRRLNQVLRRVGLNPLPAAATQVLSQGRRLAQERLHDLLPAGRFSTRDGREEGR